MARFVTDDGSYNADELQVCVRCGDEKPLSKFGTSTVNKKKYVRKYCRVCFNKNRKEYLSLHTDVLRKWRAKYVKNNLPKFNEYNRKYYGKSIELQRQKSRTKYQKMREWCDELKNKPCTDCRIVYPPCVMDWDHLHDKKQSVGRLITTGDKQRILDEIKKCELVCANCHRIRTQQRLTYTKMREKSHGAIY